ncbi:MAG TPA: hypothetical protein PLW81_15195 [Thiobacillaceae bacterium]|nr:hypothetical protein [Thiobacillaceae bacterium]
MSWIDWIRFFLAGWGLPFTTYVVIQILAVWFVRGRAKIMVAMPVPVMVLVLSFTIAAYQNSSNLWPLLVIFSSPVAILYIAVTWFLQAKRHKRTRPASE